MIQCIYTNQVIGSLLLYLLLLIINTLLKCVYGNTLKKKEEFNWILRQQQLYYFTYKILCLMRILQIIIYILKLYIN